MEEDHHWPQWRRQRGAEWPGGEMVREGCEESSEEVKEDCSAR